MFSSLPELHFKLMNFLYLICYKSDYFCFCNKYGSIKLNYNRGRQCCVLCRTKIDFYNFEDLLDKNKDNENFLKDYLNDLIPYLVECFIITKKLIECFIFGEYEYSSRDSYP